MAKAAEEQELRLAVVMTGGVSLAIWMGGVATEIDQLVRALESKQRTPEQDVYAELLAFSRFKPRVDVVSGTSAGGVNGALLAGAVARRASLDGLGDIWMDVADFSALLRSPYERDQPSLLMGDEYFTPELQKGIEKLLGDDDVTPADHPVDLLVTTTLLNGEDSALVDSYGTRIPDVRHHGLFKFDKQRLAGRHIAARLALAARSSASFPVAFEPSWIPLGPGGADAEHPDMAGVADFHANRYVIDGGVLVNRPIEPALRSIFAMRADDTDVSRVMLYVVPDPGETLATEPDKRDDPFKLADVGLRSLVSIPRTQSIARELERIQEHDERVTAQRDARDFLLKHCFSLATAESELAAYRKRRAKREVDALLGELTLRYRATMEGELGFQPIAQGDLARDLAAKRAETLPQDLTANEVASWGIDSLERAATVTLDLARRGWRRADPGAVRTQLADARTLAHTALETLRTTRAARRTELDKMGQHGNTVEALTEAVLALLRSDDDDLVAAAGSIAQALGGAAAAIRRLPAADDLKLLADQLAPAQADDRERLRRLFALEVLQEAVGLRAPVIEQPIRLLQVSANTRDCFTENKTAAQKLTGMRLMHFAAFYKWSWRANDWMWGRLDGAGWMAQLLLDPARLDTVFPHSDERVEETFEEIKKLATGGPDRAWLAKQFADDEADIKKELEWLRDKDPEVPPALPRSSMAVARRIQLSILAKELHAIDLALHRDANADALSQSGRAFRDVWQNAGEEASADQRMRGLQACRFAQEGFEAEYDSGLLARSTAGTVATLTSALAGDRSGLPKFIAASKLMTSARGLALALNGLVDTALRKSRMGFAIVMGLTAIAGGALGVAASVEGTQPLLTSFGFAVLLAAWIIGLWRSAKGAQQRKRRYARHVLLTAVVLAFCGLVSAIPWAVGKALPDCPQDTDCWEGEVESFFAGLEPAFIVLALVLGAMVFGWKAVAPPATRRTTSTPPAPATPR